MDFPQEIYEAHHRLSQCSVKFIRFMQDNPEGLRRSHFDTIVNHPIFNYYRLQPWPTFVNRETKRELKVVCIKVSNLLKGILERFFDYDVDRISQYFEIPSHRCQQLLAGVDNEYLDRLFGRGDFVISPVEGIKCIEYNIVANLGGWEQDFFEEIYANIPVISRFLTEHHVGVRWSHFLVNMMEHALESAVKRFGSHPEGEINTVLLLRDSGNEADESLVEHLQQIYKQALRNIDNSLHGELVFSDVNRLNAVDQSVRHREKPVHVIIECTRVKIPSWVMDAVKSGSLLLYNGPVVEIMSNKLTMALLSEHENSDLFSPRERDTIKKYIPWTRKLVPGESTYGTSKIRLEDFVISHQERLTIKAARGYGGYEVIMGAQVLPDQWKQRVEKALSERNWVVQEYIKPYSYIYQAGETGCVPHQVVWGVFLFGSRSPGGFVRVLPEQNPSRVINLNQGAEQSIVMEVEE